MTGKQKRALAALLSAPTKREAAKIAEISYPTLRRWITQDEDFRREYEAELAALLESAAEQVRHGMLDAVTTLRGIVADDEAPQSTRVAAAKTILDSGMRLIEAADFEARLTALEWRDNES